jgi:hypothetical protein
MSSSLRLLRWRTAVLVAGAVFVLLWLYYSSGGGAYIVQIDYTWGGELLDSAEVVIDDSVAGILLPYAGGQRIVGFEVDPGEHTVLVRGAGCEGIERTVSLSPQETRRVVLMADIDDGYRCRIRLW